MRWLLVLAACVLASFCAFAALRTPQPVTVNARPSATVLLDWGLKPTTVGLDSAEADQYCLVDFPRTLREFGFGWTRVWCPPKADHRLGKMAVALGKMGIGVVLETREDLAPETAVDVASRLQSEGARIICLEGPNEPDKGADKKPQSERATLYGGLVDYETRLATAAHAAGFRVASATPTQLLTPWNELLGPVDYANFHTYAVPGDGRDNFFRRHSSAAMAAISRASKPWIVTEFGCSTTSGRGSEYNVPLDAQGPYLFAKGIELFDKGASYFEIHEDRDNPNQPGFGVEGKPSGEYLARAFAFLRDDGEATNREVTYTFSGPDWVRLTPLAKSDGSVLFVMTGDVKFDQNAEEFSLSVAGASDLKLYDPSAGSQPIASSAGGDPLKAQIGGRPLIVQATFLPER